MKWRSAFGLMLGVLGVLALVGTLGFYWIGNVPIRAWPVVIGGLFGFMGFYLVDPIGAKDAGGTVEDFTVRVLGVIRSGRRSTDSSIVATPVVTPADDDKVKP